MSFRNKTTNGTTGSGLPKRNPQGSKPPNGRDNPGQGGKSNVSGKPGDITGGEGASVRGPKNGPDEIQVKKK